MFLCQSRIMLGLMFLSSSSYSHVLAVVAREYLCFPGTAINLEPARDFQGRLGRCPVSKRIFKGSDFPCGFLCRFQRKSAQSMRNRCPFMLPTTVHQFQSNDVQQNKSFFCPTLTRSHKPCGKQRTLCFYIVTVE